MRRNVLLGIVAATSAAVGVTLAVVIALAIPFGFPATPVRQLGTVHDVTFNVSTDKAQYRPGEPVVITGILRNTATVPVRLSQGTSCDNSLASVEDASGKSLWIDPSVYWRNCLQVIVETTLEPGQTRTYQVTWNQTDATGSAVPPDHADRVVYIVGFLEDGFEDGVWITIFASG